MKTQNPTPFDDLNEVLRELTVSAQAILGSNLMALYLQGSFATGDADEHSDVDFLAIIAQELTDIELANLQSMHQRIFALPIPWAQHLEGSYFPLDMIQRYKPQQDRPYYLDNGSSKLIRDNHDNTWVVRCTVREHGIPLLGPQPKTLMDAIPPELMKREIVKIIQSWGAEISDGRYQIDSRWAQPFVVLSYCRMLQTLSNGRIESKKVAADWAQTNLPNQWHPLIQQAWQERPNPWQKVFQPADPERVAETKAFIHFVLNISTK